LAFIDKKNDEFGTGDDIDPVDEILKRINENQIEMHEAAEPAAQETAAEETAQANEVPADAVNDEEQDDTGYEDEDEEEIADESERCARCGKRRRDTSVAEDYEFCAKCRQGMLAAPLKWQGFVAAVCAIIIAGAAVVFWAFTAVIALPVFEAGGFFGAGGLVAEKRLDDALGSYYQAQTEADTLNTQFKMKNLFTPGTKTFVKEMKVTALASGPLSVGQTLSTIKNEKIYKNIWFKELKPYNEMFAKFNATQAVVGPIVQAYQETEPADVPYDDLVAQLEALKTGPDAAKYELYFIEYYKTYAAVLANKGAETELMHMLAVKELAPQEKWLYNLYLADCYKRLERYDDMIAVCDDIIADNTNSVQAYSLKARAYCTKDDYDKALAVSAEMAKYNPANAAGYALNAEIYRRKGDVETAAAVCAEGLAGSDGSTELFRQQAIVLLLKDDIKGAYDAVNSAYNSAYYNQDTTIELINTVALCASLAGETEMFTETVNFIEQNGFKLADNVAQIIAGTKTAREVFIGGKGDVL